MIVAASSPTTLWYLTRGTGNLEAQTKPIFDGVSKVLKKLEGN